MRITIRKFANACCNGLLPTTATRIFGSVLGERFDDPNYTLTQEDGVQIDDAMHAALVAGPVAPDADLCAMFGVTVEDTVAERADELRASNDAILRVLFACGVQPVDA